jgi:hypothetical protein
MRAFLQLNHHNAPLSSDTPQSQMCPQLPLNWGGVSTAATILVTPRHTLTSNVFFFEHFSLAASLFSKLEIKLTGCYWISNRHASSTNLNWHFGTQQQLCVGSLMQGWLYLLISRNSKEKKEVVGE